MVKSISILVNNLYFHYIMYFSGCLLLYRVHYVIFCVSYISVIIPMHVCYTMSLLLLSQRPIPCVCN